MANSFEEEADAPEFENLSSLAENVVYRVPGCSDIMVRKTIQDVYRDFCRRSCCLLGRRQFTLSSEDREIVCAPKNGGVIDCIVSIVLDGYIYLDKRTFTAERGRIRFAESVIPNNRDTRDAEVTFVEFPKLCSEKIPSWFIQMYGEAVVSGTIAKLMSMTGRPWSDQQQAAREGLAYENAVCDARLRYYAETDSGDLGCAYGNDELI